MIAKTKFICLLILIATTVGCTRIDADLPPASERKSASTSLFSSIIFSNYVIGPSDGLEISYYTDPEVSDYIIDTEDKLQISFYYYPELSKTVTVRPDGFITLAKMGEIRAAGEMPRVLAEKISTLYAKQLTRPAVTVEVLAFSSKIGALREASAYQGQLKRVAVRPDGKISLPYINGDLIAAGKTAQSLSRELEEEYRKNIKNISVTVSVFEAKSYQACVVGEVQNAGCYTLLGPTTLLQIISQSGGFTKEADLSKIVVISRAADGHPVSVLRDAEQVIYKHGIDSNIRQYDIVYVQKKWIFKSSLTVKELWQLIPINFQAVYSY
ncbi:polysaccharide biosynthesis/export family protein [Desulfobulbus sp. F3]|nr:polysaccharide biosynthesis/export family protein [Desulfobulbus sp. F3]